jgi:hypothetical protein
VQHIVLCQLHPRCYKELHAAPRSVAMAHCSEYRRSRSMCPDDQNKYSVIDMCLLSDLLCSHMQGKHHRIIPSKIQTQPTNVTYRPKLHDMVEDGSASPSAPYQNWIEHDTCFPSTETDVLTFCAEIRVWSVKNGFTSFVWGQLVPFPKRV